MEALEAEVERKAREWRARIEGVPGQHVALQVLWDGDTEGWCLKIGVVCQRTTSSGWWLWRCTVVQRWALHLDTLRYGGDFRLFAGTVPPWPEALVAQRAGAGVARELGLDFYFPSPDDPDDECPPWINRVGAVRCDVCGKPILRRDGGPRCYPCELRRQSRDRILADTPRSGNGIVCIREEDDDSVARWFTLSDRLKSEIREPLSMVLRERVPPVQLSDAMDTALDPAEVARLRTWCEGRLDAALAAYRPDESLPPELGHRIVVRWRGVERTIQTVLDRPGEDIAEMLSWHSHFDPAAGRVHLFGMAGVTERDASLLAKLRADASTRDALAAAFPFLPSDALDQTLAKLEERGFVVREGDRVRPSLKGRAVW